MATRRKTEPEFITSGRARLRQWLDKSKLSQVKAAEIVGIDKGMFNHFLMGQRTPGLVSALRIERATGIPVEAWVPSSNDTSSLNDVTSEDQPLVDKA